MWNFGKKSALPLQCIAVLRCALNAAAQCTQDLGVFALIFAKKYLFTLDIIHILISSNLSWADYWLHDGFNFRWQGKSSVYWPIVSTYRPTCMYQLTVITVQHYLAIIV